MSRKREAQRDSRRTLAEQLGVKGTDVPERLLENERVTEPELRAHLDIDVAKRGLFKAPGALDVHLVLFVVDKAGPRIARRLSLRGASGRAPCAAVLSHTTTPLDHVVRYRRPGHFVLVALCTEGASSATDSVHAQALTDPRLHIVVAGSRYSIKDTALSKVTATSAQLTLASNAVIATTDVLFAGAAVVGIAAAHRVNETVVLPIKSDDARFEARLAVTLRL